MNPRTVFTKTADIGSLRVGWLRSSGQRRSLHEVNSHSETNLPTNILTKLSAAIVACGFGASMMVQAGTHGFPFLHVAVAVGGTDDERREAHDLRLGT